jgi:hypothetical protein
MALRRLVLTARGAAKRASPCAALFARTPPSQLAAFGTFSPASAARLLLPATHSARFLRTSPAAAAADLQNSLLETLQAELEHELEHYDTPEVRMVMFLWRPAAADV